MRAALLCLTFAVAYAVDMPFFFDATRAPEIFRDQLGMREAMDVWGQMIRKMTNGEKPDNVRQQVLRPKKVDKSVLKTLPKARGEIINERLLNMLLPRVRQETIDPVRDNLLSSSPPTSTSKPSTILTTLESTTTTETPTTVKETTTIEAVTTTSAAPATTTTSPSTAKETTVIRLTSIDHTPEHADEDKKPVSKKDQKDTKENVQKKTETIIKDPKLSVRIHTANETQADTMDSAVMSILMEKIDDRKASPKNRTETKTHQKTTSLVPEYTEEIRSRNVLKEKNLESEELFKDHEANSLLLHGSELLDTANSSTIADIKQLIEKIEQEVTNSTETDKVKSSEKVSSTTTASVTESTETEKVTTSEKKKTQEKMDDEKKSKTSQNKSAEQTAALDDEKTTASSLKTTEEAKNNSTEKKKESEKETEEKESDEDEDEIEEQDDEDESQEVSEEAEEEEGDELQNDEEEVKVQDSIKEDDDQKEDKLAENNEKKSTSLKQNRIPEAEDESEDSPAFIQSDDVNELSDTTTRRSVDGDVSSAGTVFNIEANANSDSKPVQTSVITPITGILDTIRPLMYYFTRPMQAAGVKSFDPENDPNYYGYQKVDSLQQLTLSDLTANIAKRLLSSGSNKPDKSRWNPSSIQDLQKNILQNYGGSSNPENQLIPLEKIVKPSTDAPTEPQVLTVEGSSQKEETEYYAPVLPKERNTLPIIARPSYTNFKKTKSTKKIITTTTTTERTTTAEASEEGEQVEEFDDGSASSVETNFLGDSGVLLGSVNMPEPEIKEAIPFALNPVTDEEPFPATYKTFGGGSFGGGRRPSIPLTDDSGSSSSSDILSFFDSKQR